MQPWVTVRLLCRDWGNEEGELVRLATVPRAGEDFYDNRGGHNTRYVVLQVSHVLSKPGDPTGVSEVQVAIARFPGVALPNTEPSAN